VTTTPAPADPSAQERLTWMGKNSRRLIIALLVLVVAAAVVVFSLSIFSSSSANPGNLVAAGTMEQSNSGDGQAILTVENLLPGESASGSVSIENVGDADGDFTLTADNLVDEPVTPAFSSVLTLVVTDGATQVYSGPLADMTTVDLGTWGAGETHDFTFEVTFDAASGNEYQDARTTLDFTWSATQSS
jgi:flagellar basal body-associated protein FliL